jgi:hypothetical protein
MAKKNKQIWDYYRTGTDSVSVTLTRDGLIELAKKSNKVSEILRDAEERAIFGYVPTKELEQMLGYILDELTERKV